MEGLSCEQSEQNRGQGLAFGKFSETMPLATSEKKGLYVRVSSLHIVNLPLEKKKFKYTAFV